MKYIFITALLFFSTSITAQKCTDESLLQKPGTWNESSGGGSGVTAADLAREKKVVAAINKMIKLKYTPMGVSAFMNGGYNRSESNMAGNGYTYSIIPLNFYCEGNSIKTEGETPTYFSINANISGAAIYDTAQGDRLLLEGFNVIYDLPVQKDGYWFVKEKLITLLFGIPETGKEAQWLITYDGKLPFSYVTKKEFLIKRKKALGVQMLDAAAGFKDVLDRIEIEKKYKEAEYKNDPVKLNKYMKMDYLEIKARYEKLLAENENKFKPVFDKLEAQLKLPAIELNEQAIVKDDPYNHLSYLFTDANDPFRKILIKPNPEYFNKKLPKSSPQFYWVYVRWSHKDPIASKFNADIMKAVDFAALKNMLGK